MLRQHAVEPLSRIVRPGSDGDHFIGGQHLPLAGLGHWLGAAIHVFVATTRILLTLI
jgi:hypothetical protein